MAGFSDTFKNNLAFFCRYEVVIDIAPYIYVLAGFRHGDKVSSATLRVVFALALERATKEGVHSGGRPQLSHLAGSDEGLWKWVLVEERCFVGRLRRVRAS